MDSIIGLMFNKNESDILEETLESFVGKVDRLFVADDGSTDNSWDIIKGFKERYSDKVCIQRAPDKNDPGQRQSLLNKIRLDHTADNSWVQICESDIMILDTDIRWAIEHWSRDNVLVDWTLLNAVRKPGTWKEVDTYPNWSTSIKEIMPYAHVMEVMTYTFRPFPDLFYTSTWKPWPNGFSKYIKTSKVEQENPNIRGPLLAHYGWRGPKHTFNKFKGQGRFHKKHRSWDFQSVESTELTVPMYNGTYNKDSFPLSREGYINRKV